MTTGDIHANGNNVDSAAQQLPPKADPTSASYVSKNPNHVEGNAVETTKVYGELAENTKRMNDEFATEDRVRGDGTSHNIPEHSATDYLEGKVERTTYVHPATVEDRTSGGLVTAKESDVSSTAATEGSRRQSLTASERSLSPSGSRFHPPGTVEQVLAATAHPRYRRASLNPNDPTSIDFVSRARGRSPSLNASERSLSPSRFHAPGTAEQTLAQGAHPSYRRGSIDPNDPTSHDFASRNRSPSVGSNKRPLSPSRFHAPGTAEQTLAQGAHPSYRRGSIDPNDPTSHDFATRNCRHSRTHSRTSSIGSDNGASIPSSPPSRFHPPGHVEAVLSAVSSPRYRRPSLDPNDPSSLDFVSRAKSPGRPVDEPVLPTVTETTDPSTPNTPIPAKHEINKIVTALDPASAEYTSYHPNHAPGEVPSKEIYSQANEHINENGNGVPAVEVHPPVPTNFGMGNTGETWGETVAKKDVFKEGVN